MSTGVSERTPPKTDHRKVGVLGGMGPHATQAFYGELIRWTSAGSDQDHLDVVIESSSSIPDRSAFLLGRGPDPRPSLHAAGRRLVAVGAQLIVMPCNTAQVFLPTLEAALNVPFIPWIETAIDELQLHHRPPVGILATAGTVHADLYGAALRQRGIDYVQTDEKETETLMGSIYAYKATNRAARADQARVLRVAEALHDRGARVLVLGCTELPLIVSPTSAQWPAPVVDPAVTAARRTVIEAGGRVASR